jgi:hypothetical protein
MTGISGRTIPYYSSAIRSEAPNPRVPTLPYVFDLSL